MMSRSRLESLPTDIFLAFLDLLDLPTKALLARCNKTLRDAIGINVVHELQNDRECRQRFFLQLEKDLPTDQFFCPGCDLFHDISRRPIGNKAPCRKADWRNEVNEFYGRGFNFYQARFALRLHQRQDPRASQYLQELEGIEPRGWHDRNSLNREFWNRDLRIATIRSNSPPQLFLRSQHWHLMPHKDVKKRKLDDFHFSTVQICRHQLNPVLSESFYPWTPFEFGLYKIKYRIRQMQQNNVSEPDHHEHTQLFHCQTCATDYQMDIFYIPEASPSHRRIFTRGTSQCWAIVVTKWMDLGTLDVQDGEWQAHAFTERARMIRYTVDRLGPGSAVHIFEKEGAIGDDLGELEYKPYWSKDFERKVVAAFE